MKCIILSVLLCFSILAYSQNQIVGIWLTEEKDGKIQIYQRDGKYFGKIVWVNEPNDKDGKPKTDKENPDSKLRNQPILGLILLKNFEYKKPEWTNGTIYDPKSGKTYKSTLWFENDKTLNVRGYWGFIYSTTKWTRVEK